MNLYYFLVVALTGIGGATVFSKSIILYRQIKDYLDNARKYRELKKKRDMMLKNGEMHKWIDVTAPDGKSKITVCENTGWCPSKKGFLPKGAIEALKDLDNLESEYAAFETKRKEEISKHYGVSISDVSNIYTDVVSIKKDFYLNRMTESLKNMGVKND